MYRKVLKSFELLTGVGGRQRTKPDLYVVAACGSLYGVHSNNLIGANLIERGPKSIRPGIGRKLPGFA
jgi:hypothetical protein